MKPRKDFSNAAHRPIRPRLASGNQRGRQCNNETLIKRVIANDDRAITQLYWQYVPRLRRFFKGRITNRKDAEEVVHDTFLSVLDALPSFDGRSKLSTWIIGVAKHELVDYYRRKRIKKILFSRFPFLEKLVDQALGPQLALEEKQLKQRILKTFQILSEGYAQILRLKYVEGLSVAEIAQTLEVSYKAAESRLTRARLAFQKAFVETQKVHFNDPQVWDPPLP